MAVTSTNLIQGPATLYVAAFGTAEPATVATVPGAGWVDVGGTKDGVALMHTKEFAILDVDQLVDEVGRTVVKRTVGVKTSLAEPTLVNLATAYSNSAPVGNELEPDTELDAFTSSYYAILLDGIAPGGFRRRIIVRKALSVDSVESTYKKDGMTLVPVNFMGHYVSISIKPFSIEDAVA